MKSHQIFNSKKFLKTTACKRAYTVLKHMRILLKDPWIVTILNFCKLCGPPRLSSRTPLRVHKPRLRTYVLDDGWCNQVVLRNVSRVWPLWSEKRVPAKWKMRAGNNNCAMAFDDEPFSCACALIFLCKLLTFQPAEPKKQHTKNIGSIFMYMRVTIPGTPGSKGVWLL